VFRRISQFPASFTDRLYQQSNLTTKTVEPHAERLLVKHLVGEQAAGNVANVKLQQRVVVRRVGQRVAARLAVPQLKVDVLPGQKLQAFVGGELILTTITSSARFFEFSTRHGSVLTTMSFDAPISLASITMSGQRFGAAEQARPCAFSSSLRALGECFAVVEFAGQHLALAGPQAPLRQP